MSIVIQIMQTARNGVKQPIYQRYVHHTNHKGEETFTKNCRCPHRSIMEAWTCRNMVDKPLLNARKKATKNDNIST